MTTTSNKYEIDLCKSNAKKFGISNFDEIDIIFEVDPTNCKDINFLCRSNTYKTKVHIMLGKLDLPDPHFCERDGFELIYQLTLQDSQRIFRKY